MNDQEKVFEALQSLAIHEPMSKYNETRNSILTSSNMKIAAQESLADYRAKTSGVVSQVQTPAMLEGRAHHTLTVEGNEPFLNEYVVGGPINPATNCEYGVGTKKFLDAEAQVRAKGKTLITRDMADRCGKVRDSVRAHPILNSALNDGIAEATFKVNLYGVDCKVRVDYLHPRFGIIDLKTCESLGRFERDAEWKYGYYYSAAFYRSVLHALVPDLPPLPYSFIAVEKSGIYKCGMFNMDDDLLQHYEDLNATAIKDIAEANITGAWPTGYEKVQSIQLKERL